MSKIESRDFWVTGEIFLKLSSGKDHEHEIFHAHSVYCDSFNHKKVSISWEIPEKVVSISESEFDKAVAEIAPWEFRERIDRLKEKLFKGKE